MDMRVQPAGCDDLALCGDHLGTGTNLHPRRDASHQIWVASLADPNNAAIPDANVGFHNAPVIQNDGVGDDEIKGATRACRGWRLPHPIPNDFAAAELGFLPRRRQVALDLDDQFRVGQTDFVAGRRAVQIGILAAWNLHGSPRALCPLSRFSPLTDQTDVTA